MEEAFELPVRYNNSDLLFSAALQTSQYSHRILVSLENEVLVFEPDEERNYRVITQNVEANTNISLVRAIAEAIESAFK